MLTMIEIRNDISILPIIYYEEHNTNRGLNLYLHCCRMLCK